MQIVLDQIVIGLTRGAEYALVAAGLSLIFGVLQIVNFAHGEFYMVGAYALLFAETKLGLAYPLASLLAVSLMLGFGAAFYWVAIDRIISKGWQVQLVATLAASILLVNLVGVIAGPLPTEVQSPLTSVVITAGTVHFALQRVLVIACAVIAFTLLYCMLAYTKLGKAMRALSQNPDAAAVVGISARRIGLATVLTGAVLAGVASVTIPPLGNVSPTMGSLPTIKAFAAVIMGGFGNVTGAIVSAFILGLVEALGIGFVSSQYGDAFVFAVMILVLMLRPHGLFGRIARA